LAATALIHSITIDGDPVTPIIYFRIMPHTLEPLTATAHPVGPSEIPHASRASGELNLPAGPNLPGGRNVPGEPTVPDGHGPAHHADHLGAHLREVAGLVEDRDRLMGRVVRLLVGIVHAEGLHARLGGMTLQVWVEHVCRIPGPDARALLGAVDVLTRLPSVVVGLCDRWLSWPQVQAISRAARSVPVGRLPELDTLVAQAMVTRADVEPDALVDDVWAWVDRMAPSRRERAERDRERGEFVSMTPRLFGGGSMFAELGTVSFATVAEALDAALGPPPAVDADDLADMDDADVDTLVESLDDRRRAHTRQHGARMARRLVDLCAASLGGAPDAGGRAARPLVVATVGLDALLDEDRTPGWLLHTLAGGRMKVSARALQRLVDERGADLRGVVLDDCGQVVGVGRTTHEPPGWLRQAIWARDVHVADPDGATPIRRADLDHVVAWPDGPTDVANLQPLGRRWHNLKTSKAWTVTRAGDGSTVWRHRRHGWMLRMAATGPARFRPPERPPGRHDPSDPDGPGGPSGRLPGPDTVDLSIGTPRHSLQHPPGRQLALTGVP
jgi:hypothetical protein